MSGPKVVDRMLRMTRKASRRPLKLELQEEQSMLDKLKLNMAGISEENHWSWDSFLQQDQNMLCKLNLNMTVSANSVQD